LEESFAEFIPFICITETWLKSYVSDSQIAIDGYSSLRADREKIQRGGVLMYVNNTLPISDAVTYDKGNCEAVMGTLSSVDTIVVNLYRPPKTTDEDFTNLLNEVQNYLDNAMTRKHHDIFVTGDFNLPATQWNTHTTDHSQGQARGIVPAQRLFDFMDRNFLTQVVDKPTRDGNILDLVLTNCPHYVNEVKSQEIEISDHNLVSVTLGFDLRTPTDDRAGGITPDPYSFRSLNCFEGDFEKMNDDFQDINWEQLFTLCAETDGADFMELMRLTTLQLALLHCPRRLTPGKPANQQKKRPVNRQKQVLKRKKRKLKSRLSAIERHEPNSPMIQEIKNQISLLCIDIRDAINTDFNYRRELKAVSTLKKNPRFFFSYAKKHSKLKSNV